MKRSTNSSVDMIPDPMIKRHQRQCFWQIILPITVIGLLSIFTMVILARGNPGFDNLAQIAHTSTMLMILPVLMFAFLFLVILVAMIILVALLTHKVPEAGQKVQRTFTLIKHFSFQATSVSVKPILAVKEIWAGIVQLVNRLFHYQKRGQNQ